MNTNDQVNNNDTISDNDILTLSFLTWLDTLERLDTLLLEARHLQKNILYFLREPKLYYPLDHEEGFIWLDCKKLFEDKENILKKLNDIGHEPGKELQDLQDLVDQIIILYPLYPQEKSNKFGGRKNGDQLERTVFDRLNGGFWNREQRSHYFNLTAIQKIKRNILRDKLLLCQKGIKTFKVLSSDQGIKTELKVENQLWQFILLRCLVLARARAYVDRLGDHQDIFTNNQDVGLLHPRPSARRRREQDLYNVHLSDRCNDIGREMNLLMKRLIKSSEPKPQPQLIFHHWQHNFSSASFSFTDELDVEDPITPHQHYIKTSYWMPERPDLQSVIAHEVAHSVIREWLGNLSWQTLDSTKSDFCLLLKQLHQCCAIFEVHKYSGVIPLREIAVDLLATAVVGPAYLHALFLELLGSGLEDMFAINQSDQFEVGLIDYLESVIGPYSNIRDWYYRLHLVCVWLEEIDETAKNKGALCQRLINSCQKILEGLHNFLELNAPPKDKHGNYWSTLKKRLCEIVRESEVVYQVKTWRKERREDHRSEIDQGWKKGERKFPRFTRPLHPRLRNFLFEGFIGKKIALIQKIERSGEKTKCNKQIKDIYKLQINKNLEECYLNKRSSLADDPVSLICESLFEQIYDIPWQCTFLRGLDFVNPKSHIRPKNGPLWLEQMHEDTALGRELYQLGLDFYLHDIEPARNRLLEIVHVLSVARSNKNFISRHPSFITIVDEWTNGRNFEEINKNDVDKFIEELKELEDLKRKSLHDDKYHKFYEEELQTSCEDAVKGVSPDILLEVEAYQKIAKEDIRRILTKLQGLKLKQLLEIFRKLGENERLIVEPLQAFLEVRDKTKNSENPLSQGFHSFLFQAFSKEEIKKHNQPNEVVQWNCPDTYLISRICSTSSLDTKDPKDRPSPYQKSWSFDFKNNKIIFDPVKEPDEMENYENYQVLLGRYDWLTIRKLKPMCRYGIPRFPPKCEINNDPVFLNNFTRREMALPVRLGKKRSWNDVHKWDDDRKDHNIFALISIKLNRYTARLDFLTRLLHVTRESKTEDRSNIDPCNLNQLKGYIHEDFGDRAFLTDGWGDILLILGNERLRAKSSKDKNEHEARCLEDVFKIQSVLFEDFQVDRTEFILTPKCLDIAVRHLDLFSVVFQFRLMGDCTLEQANRNCVESLQKSIEKNLKKKKGVRAVRALNLTSTVFQVEWIT